MKISSYQLRKRWEEDYNKMIPTNVYRGYCIGYRRALKDLKKVINNGRYRI